MPRPDRVTIEIADNGRGIAEQDIDRVFELFRRAARKDAPGEGVGLAYVQGAGAQARRRDRRRPRTEGQARPSASCCRSICAASETESAA